MLYEPRRASLAEAKWAFVGGALGSTASALNGVANWWAMGTMETVDLLQIVICAVAASIAFAIYKIDARLVKNPKSLAEEMI